MVARDLFVAGLGSRVACPRDMSYVLSRVCTQGYPGHEGCFRKRRVARKARIVTSILDNSTRKRLKTAVATDAGHGRFFT